VIATFWSSSREDTGIVKSGCCHLVPASVTVDHATNAVYTTSSPFLATRFVRRFRCESRA